MMRMLVILAVIAACSAERIRGVYEQPDYEAYKAKYNKVYSDLEENLVRYERYLNNIALINQHNMEYDAGKHTWWMGVNPYIDWTQEEWDRRNGFVPREQTGPIHQMSGKKLAESVDWRERGAIGDVKNQGSCGSCWAFGTVAALESSTFLKTGTLPNCSEQQLVSCDTYDSGCNGGWLETVYNYISENGENGIDTQASYPYTGKDDACQTDKTQDGQDVAATCTGHTNCPGEDALKDACANKGVIAIALHASVAFQLYAGGIFDDILCLLPVEANHAVSVVGYNDAEQYWIVRNSWGASWGESGHIRMKMGHNQCKMADYAIYPNL